MRDLQARMRDVRVCNGSWERVLSNSVTTRHGLTAVFLDPPYAKGAMDYAAGGMGTGIAEDVRQWCLENGDNPKFRIALCGHAGEHALPGWTEVAQKSTGGYGSTDEAAKNRASETIWFSPHCIQVHTEAQLPLASGATA